MGQLKKVIEKHSKIAKQILSDEYSDYKKNAWHYDREYKMLMDAMKLSALESQEVITTGEAKLYYKGIDPRFAQDGIRNLISKYKPTPYGELALTNEIIEYLKLSQSQITDDNIYEEGRKCSSNDDQWKGFDKGAKAMRDGKIPSKENQTNNE